GCGHSVMTSITTTPTTEPSTHVILTYEHPVTVELNVLELANASEHGALSSQNGQLGQPGIAEAPALSTRRGGLGLSAIASCTPLSAMLGPLPFRPAGITTPGVDVAYALANQDGDLGAAWGFEGDASWQAMTVGF